MGYRSVTLSGVVINILSTGLLYYWVWTITGWATGLQFCLEWSVTGYATGLQYCLLWAITGLQFSYLVSTSGQQYCLCDQWVSGTPSHEGPSLILATCPSPALLPSPSRHTMGGLIFLGCVALSCCVSIALTFKHGLTACRFLLLPVCVTYMHTNSPNTYTLKWHTYTRARARYAGTQTHTPKQVKLPSIDTPYPNTAKCRHCPTLRGMDPERQANSASVKEEKRKATDKGRSDYKATKTWRSIGYTLGHPEPTTHWNLS